jgi:hypothetical protein
VQTAELRRLYCEAIDATERSMGYPVLVGYVGPQTSKLRSASNKEHGNDSR